MCGGVHSSEPDMGRNKVKRMASAGRVENNFQEGSNRSCYQYKGKRVKLRETVGVIGNKKFLKFSMLNVDGMSNSSFEDVKNVLCTKQSDVCVILETKSKRREESGIP